MTTAEVVDVGGEQMVRLPEGFRFEADTVSVRREGEAVILEPVRTSTWPEGFFKAIHIADPSFVRPDQGGVPPVPSLD
jgi:virulence-associated protein VagC